MFYYWPAPYGTLFHEMTDTRSPEQRRRIMQSVGVKDTGPERTVRRLLHRLGFRFRLHRKDLPGKPDIVFPSRKKVIFVHGCFWHGHDCRYGRAPKSKADYWQPKLARNKERDAENVARLREMGWEAAIVWQCEIKDLEAVAEYLTEFLDGEDVDRIRSTFGSQFRTL